MTQGDEGASTPQRTAVETLTLLLTDIEGSTRLWEEHPEAMRVAIGRHHELASASVAEHGGYRPPDQGEGDSIFVVFADAAAAVACALDLQRAWLVEPWPEPVELRARIALHTGAVQLRDGRNYAGVAISRCARLRAIAHGGQTLLSEATRVLVSSALPPGSSLRDLGTHGLKDLTGPEHVFQLVHAGAPDEFPPLRSLDAVRHNLPIQLTRFVGRERELAELSSLLQSCRLLTLSGPGGVGKTRLALQLAAQLIERYPDGVWLAELGSVTAGAPVTRVVAAAVGVREHHGQSLAAAIVDGLAATDTLVLLDNCEHVIDACSELVEHILSSCPRVTVLATSREPLSVRGEVLWRIPSLSLAHADGAVGGTSDAVQLFADRAVAADPSFSVTAETVQEVDAVCSRLDGIPLALELAAASLRAFTLGQLSERLAAGISPTGATIRGMPSRQQTLAATVEWSHDLLSEPERVVFRRLSVFVGGFRPDGAAAVCASDAIEPADVAELFGRLVLRSLVERESDAGLGRYRLLEPIRAYAVDRLRDAGEEEPLRVRHLEWCLRLAEQVEPELTGSTQGRGLDALHSELGNFRSALERSLEREDAASTLRLGCALHEFWMVRADWGEGRAWIERALELGGAVQPELRMRALAMAGELADALSDYPGATRHYEESLKIARATGDRRGIARSLLGLAHESGRVGRHASARPLLEEAVAILRDLGEEPDLARSLGGLAWLENDYGRSLELLREELAIRRRLGNPESVSWSLVNIGFCAAGAGDYEAAEQSYGEALELARKLGHRRLTARCLTQLGELAFLRGDTAGAQACYDESLPIWREIGHKSGLVDALRGLGDVGCVQGDVVGAQSLIEESLDVCRATGNTPSEGAALISLAAVARARGDSDGARRLLEQSLQLFDGMSDMPGMATTTERLGELAVERGEFERAAELLGRAEALRSDVGMVVPAVAREEHGRAVAAIRAALGDERFERAWASGSEAVGAPGVTH